MSIIIPASVDQGDVRVPMQFPLKPDADSVVDSQGRLVMKLDASIAPAEAIKFAKLFSQAPLMWELLGESYALLGFIGCNTEGFQHGTEDEANKEDCLLCKCEALLNYLS